MLNRGGKTGGHEEDGDHVTCHKDQVGQRAKMDRPLPTGTRGRSFAL